MVKDTTMVIRNRKSEDRQYNDQRKKAKGKTMIYKTLEDSNRVNVKDFALIVQPLTDFL